MATQLSAVGLMSRAAKRVSTRQAESAWNAFYDTQPFFLRKGKGEMQALADRTVDFLGHHGDGSMKFMGSGVENAVFDIGDNKVLKVLHNADMSPSPIPNLPEVLQPLSVSADRTMAIFPKAQTEGMTRSQARGLHRSLKSRNWLWKDVKPENIGLVNGEAKVIDAGRMTQRPRATVHSPLNDQVRQAIADVRRGQLDASKSMPKRKLLTGPMLGEMDAYEELSYLMADRRSRATGSRRMRNVL